MYLFSDSDSADTDEGVRFKTETTRKRHHHCTSSQQSNAYRNESLRDHDTRRRHHSRHRSRSRERLSRPHRSSSRSRTRRRSRSSRDKLTPSGSTTSRNRRENRNERDETKKREKNRRKDEKSSRSTGENASQKTPTSDVKIIVSEKNHYSENARKIVESTETSQNTKTDRIEQSVTPTQKEDKKITNNVLETLEGTDERNTQNINENNIDIENKEFYGPVLPRAPNSEIKTDQINQTNIDCELKIREFSSKLPPLTQPSKIVLENQIIGPQLPDILTSRKHVMIPTEKIVATKRNYIGPELPPHLMQVKNSEDNEFEDQIYEDDDDDDIYGPLPINHLQTSDKNNRKLEELEERALEIKLGYLGGGNESAQTVRREQWMTELPDAVNITNLGLSARQFRQKAGPDMSDRSSWTDTPSTKQQKKKGHSESPYARGDLKKEAELREIIRRDAEQEKMSQKFARKETVSLVELHRRKIKNETKGVTEERRPFSRELDLQVNRFDESQKKAVLKKAQLLDDRFMSGQSKYI